MKPRCPASVCSAHWRQPPRGPAVYDPSTTPIVAVELDHGFTRYGDTPRQPMPQWYAWHQGWGSKCKVTAEQADDLRKELEG